jgi:hypothetical protein
MSKLGDPVAPDSFVDAAMIDHQKNLTRDPPLDNAEDIFILQRVKSEIAHICRSIFQNQRFTHCDPIPSLRACFENKLPNGGGFGELLGHFSLPRCCHVDSLYGMSYSPVLGVRELRFVDGSIDVEEFQNYVDLTWADRIMDPLDATPCPILEPLKVRMITKGQAAEYYRTIELQKFMHSRLKRHPVFEYIGHPIDDLSWSQCFGTREDLSPGEFFVSGDYKGATDNLRRELSEHAWSMICQYASCEYKGRVRLLVETPYYFLGLKALTHHRLHYPNGDVVAQTWGQLMGSPMSFPILCIVNAAASLVSQYQTFSAGVRMKVNGDDIGFITDEPGYRTWKSVTAICGLEFSLGKNYTSRDFLLMNSELRRPPRKGSVSHYKVLGREGCPGDEDHPWRTTIAWEEQPKPWRLEGFVNQAVLYHRVKKGTEAGQQKDVYWTDLESLSHEAIRGIPDKDQWSLLSEFLTAHKPVLKELPHLCNLWFPKSLGGAGCAIPKGKTLESLTQDTPTDLLMKERKQAAYLACNPVKRQKRVTRSRPITGKIGASLRDLLSVSNKQLSPTLRFKPLNREQHVLVGSKTMLGYLLRDLAGLEDLGGDLRGESLKGTGVTELHMKEAQYLRNQYSNWLRSALRTSLQPMDLSHIQGYQEHYELYSSIELLVEAPSQRPLDKGFW